MKQAISFDDIALFREKFESDRTNKVAMNACTKNGLKKAAASVQASADNLHNEEIGRASCRERV